MSNFKFFETIFCVCFYRLGNTMMHIPECKTIYYYPVNE